MASERKTGLGTLPTGLIRPTTPPEPIPPDGPAPEEPAEAVEGQGRGGGAPEARAAKPRRKRAPVSSEATRGRKLYLPDDIHDRLRLLAFQRRANVSTVAAEILDRNLPRFRLDREG